MKSFIILCGGKSKRMGKDKGSLVLEGRPMLLHVLDTASSIADEIILVLRDDEQEERYKKIIDGNYDSIDIIKDKMTDKGPLVGILTGLSAIKSDYAQVLPCDSPFVSEDFLLKMFKIAGEDDFEALVPVGDDDKIEPLHSIYKKDVKDAISILLNEEKRDIQSLIKQINTIYVDIRELDPTKKSFKNINTIEDFKKY